ncbi:hypothetical protein [Streptomyces griseosporeus]|uniref:hypothetical protein n=1 Tax=Streptomyces griseosporeus TaxID=1910 RepID=UPI0036F4CEB2
MSKTATTAMAPSTPDQHVSITASLTAEIVIDADNGESTLVAYSEGNAGDLEVVTPARLLAKVAALREQADRIEALANEYAAQVVIPRFLEHFRIELEELDIASLTPGAPDLAARFRAFCAVKDDGSVLVAVPKGQAPAERLAAIRDLVIHLDLKAGQA